MSEDVRARQRLVQQQRRYMQTRLSEGIQVGGRLGGWAEAQWSVGEGGGLVHLSLELRCCMTRVFVPLALGRSPGSFHHNPAPLPSPISFHPLRTPLSFRCPSLQLLGCVFGRRSRFPRHQRNRPQAAPSPCAALLRTPRIHIPHHCPLAPLPQNPTFQPPGCVLLCQSRFPWHRRGLTSGCTTPPVLHRYTHYCLLTSLPPLPPRLCFLAWKRFPEAPTRLAASWTSPPALHCYIDHGPLTCLPPSSNPPPRLCSPA